MWRDRIIGLIAVSICITLLTRFVFLTHISVTSPIRSTSDDHSTAPPSTTVNVQETGAIIPSTSHAALPSYDVGPVGCPERWDWLKELDGSADVSFPLNYARREIVVRRQAPAQHASLSKSAQALLPNFQRIESLDALDAGSAGCSPPLILDVPFRPKIDAPHILLGVASTVERLEASFTYFERWLAFTGIRMFVVIKGQDEKSPDRARMDDMQERMREHGMNVTLVPPLRRRDSFIKRYFSLAKILYENRDVRTQWLGFVDDDTFFVSMTALVERLQRFDHRQKHYLGALSEEWHTVVLYGLVGMGGAGVFLSLPAAQIIYDNYDVCRKKTTRTFGDHMIAECLEQHSNVRLNHVDGLYQIDLHGDRSGVFESGRQILTLHHWKEGYWSEDGAGADGIRHSRWFPMDKMALVQEVCGDSCFLQRFHFGNDTILTNGYSIAQYPRKSFDKHGNGTSIDLDKMEYTWVKPGGTHVAGSLNDGYAHYLGPTRPALGLDTDKIHWRFMDAQIVDGGVRQYFRRLGKDGRADELVELFWRVGGTR